MVEVAKRTDESNAMLNKGRGMWNIISLVLAAVQVALVYFMSMYLSDIKSLHAEDVGLEKRIIILEQHR
jgi:hypothetical protein